MIFLLAVLGKAGFKPVNHHYFENGPCVLFKKRERETVRDNESENGGLKEYNTL